MAWQKLIDSSVHQHLSTNHVQPRLHRFPGQLLLLPLLLGYGDWLSLTMRRRCRRCDSSNVVIFLSGDRQFLDLEVGPGNRFHFHPCASISADPSKHCGCAFIRPSLLRPSPAFSPTGTPLPLTLGPPSERADRKSPTAPTCCSRAASSQP